jgi:hypothetical protein
MTLQQQFQLCVALAIVHEGRCLQTQLNDGMPPISPFINTQCKQDAGMTSMMACDKNRRLNLNESHASRK